MTTALPERRAAGRPAHPTAARWRFALCALLLAWVALLLPRPILAQDLQRVPPLTGRVVDHSATLAPEQVRSLESKLAALEAERGTQIVILVVPGTAPEDIAAFAFRVADEWKIGRREVGDGILLVVAKNERRVRIEVARALEGAVPDLAAFQIINRVITPAFRDGDYAGGLHAGVDALIALIRGENLPLPEAEAPAPSKPSALEGLGALLFMGVPLVGAVLVGTLGRKLGALATSGAAGAFALFITGSVLLALLAAVLAFIFVLALGIGGGGGGGGGPRMGGGPVIWGGGGRGGRSGGGFRSGGGGSFGGGGASGGW
jgi:uncharacterized protein